jgi:hypothetical protein
MPTEEYDSIVEFNELESFSYLFKEMWDGNTTTSNTTNKPTTSNSNSSNSNRVKFRIVDTLLYKEGQPFRWLFTSVKTGPNSYYHY